MQRLWLCLLRGWVAGWRQSVLLHGRSLPKLTADWGNWIWRNTRFTTTSLEPLGKVHPPSELFPPLPPTHSLLFKQVWLGFPVTQKIPEPEPPERWQMSGGMWERMTQKEYEGVPWCPVVKISPSSAWGVYSIPGQGAKIPHAPRPPKKRKKKRNVKWKQYCNKFNEDFKNGPHQNTNLKKKRSLRQDDKMVAASSTQGLWYSLRLVKRAPDRIWDFSTSHYITNQCSLPTV